MEMRNGPDQSTDLLTEQDRSLRGTTRTGHPHAAGESHEIVSAAPVAENTGHTVFRDPAVQEGVDRPHDLLSKVAVFLFEALRPDSFEFLEPAFDNAAIVRSFRAAPLVHPGFGHGLAFPLQEIRIGAEGQHCADRESQEVVADNDRDQAMLSCCAVTCERTNTRRCERFLSGEGAFLLSLDLLYLREGKRRSQNNTKEEETIGPSSLFIYHLRYVQLAMIFLELR
jgi:hypothetical protein